MKKIIAFILVVTFCALIIYLLGSFISMSFNIDEWNYLTRMLTGCLFSYCFCYIISEILE